MWWRRRYRVKIDKRLNGVIADRNVGDGTFLRTGFKIWKIVRNRIAKSYGIENEKHTEWDCKNIRNGL